jgi:hypothetical protein
MKERRGQTGRFRIILPETVAEFERWSFDVRKTFCLSSVSVPGVSGMNVAKKQDKKL